MSDRQMEELMYLRRYTRKLELEVEALKAAGSRATELMMSGEHLREQLMFKAICGGVFGGSYGSILEGR